MVSCGIQLIQYIYILTCDTKLYVLTCSVDILTEIKSTWAAKPSTIFHEIWGDVYMFTSSFINWPKIIPLRWKDCVSVGACWTSDSIAISYVNILSWERRAGSRPPAGQERGETTWRSVIVRYFMFFCFVLHLFLIFPKLVIWHNISVTGPLWRRTVLRIWLSNWSPQRLKLLFNIRIYSPASLLFSMAHNNPSQSHYVKLLFLKNDSISTLFK